MNSLGEIELNSVECPLTPPLLRREYRFNQFFLWFVIASGYIEEETSIGLGENGQKMSNICNFKDFKMESVILIPSSTSYA